MADAPHSKCGGAIRAGSSPAIGTRGTALIQQFLCWISAVFLYIIQESARKINDKPRTKKVRKHCNAQRTGLFLITPAGRFDKTPRMVLEQYHPKIILKHFCVSANAVAVKCSYFAVIDGILCSLPLAALWKVM